jgi:hypothetical protein
VPENPAFRNFAASVNELNVMTMTPLEALNRLYELQKEAAEIIETPHENVNDTGEFIR